MVVSELSGISRIQSRYRLRHRARHELVSCPLMSRCHRGLGDRFHDHGQSLSTSSPYRLHEVWLLQG